MPNECMKMEGFFLNIVYCVVPNAYNGEMRHFKKHSTKKCRAGKIVCPGKSSTIDYLKVNHLH